MKKPQHRRAKPKAKRTPSTAPTGVGGRGVSGGAGHKPRASAMGRAGRVVANRRAPVSGLLDAGFNRARAVLGGFRQQTQRAVALAAVPPEDRQTAALLLMPFVILAIAIAGNQSLQLGRHLEALIARPVPPMVLPTTQDSARRVVVAPTPVTMPQPVAVTTPAVALSPRTVAGPSLADRTPEGALPDSGPATEPMPKTAARIELAAVPVSGRPLATNTDRLEVRPAVAPVEIAAGRVIDAVRRADAPLVAGVGGSQVAALSLAPLQMPGLQAFEEGERWRSRRVSLDERCVVADGTGKASGRRRTGPPSTAAGGDLVQVGFGERLAAAGRKQLDDLVIYDDAYRSISYPNGDVPKLYGVCTDVVIRAYRDLGVDLQVAVQAARVGSGDRNIDHRRTETLRRFFQAAGESLPVTNFAEDYLAGDIVTYARPQNTGTSSRSHIAMVSDVMAPSGRPMILHNRGWGPQLEDALFVDQITGHYRYDGRRGIAAGKPRTVGETDPDQVRLKSVGQRRLPGAHAERSQPGAGPQRRRTSNALDLTSSGKTAHR